jgi:hypothetical protein
MLKRTGKMMALTALVLGATIATASADCEAHKATGTLLGAGAGSVVLGALTHSPAGWIGGAVLGGFAGHSISSDHCRHDRHGYYDRDHHWHSYG